MIANPPIESLIYFFNHYKKQAERCFEIYHDICEAYFMFDYYMEMATIYEQAILINLNN